MRLSSLVCSGICLLLLLLWAPSAPACSISSSFVVNSSVVAVFNSSTDCALPFFPNVATTGNDTFSVSIICIGGGGAGGNNGGGGGGGGGVVFRSLSVSTSQLMIIVVGRGGGTAIYPPVWPSPNISGSPATAGGSSSVSLSAAAGTVVSASGGGSGGSRDSFDDTWWPTGGGGGCGGGGAGGGGCCVVRSNYSFDNSGGAGVEGQGQSGGMGWLNGSDAGCNSAGAGGGGFRQAGTNGADCWSGSGGDGYELPFAPILSEYVSGGGAGGLTCYTRCSNPILGRNGSGQSGYGGGGHAGTGAAPSQPAYDPQAGRDGAVFISFTFACPAGTLQVVISGFFSGSPCSLCPSGSYSDSIGLSSCTLCTRGSYNPSSGSSSAAACQLCLAGSYSSASGQSACHPCAPGYFSSANGSVECSPCPAGFFCPTKGSSGGLPCAEGYYCPPASSLQTPCPQNTYSTSQKQATGCAACPPGELSHPGSAVCSACVPSPFDSETFTCYSTASKIVVVLAWCVCVFITVFSLFKIFATLKKRKAHLEEKGITPTFQRLIFYQTALASAVSLQPLIGAQSGPNLSQDSFSTLPKPSPRAIL